MALGGLARRLAFYKAVRDTTRDVLCLDAGDWSPPPDYTTVPRTGATIVSANVLDRRGRRLLRDHLIIERSGVRIGVTGVTDSLDLIRCPTPEVSFGNMEQALRATLATLRPRVDCVVVLLHAGPNVARRVAETIPGIDVIITGHNPGYLKDADRIGATSVVRGGNRGQYAALTMLTFDASNHLVDARGRVSELDPTLPADSALAALVGAFVARHHINTNF